MTAAVPAGSAGSLIQRNQSVTEGPWVNAVNWVKSPGQPSTNMTQYRANARNCEAKRLHIRALRRVLMSVLRDMQASLSRAAAWPHTLWCASLDMANCLFPTA
jgi:hypothetical protein